MAQITGFTAQRMLEIENNTVVSGTIVGDDLILTTYGGDPINAGNVRGPVGPQGPIGEVSQAELDAALAALVLGVDGIADGSITAVKLAPNSVETAKINDLAVTSSKIGLNQVNNGHLAPNSVDSGQYVDGSIDPEHLANNAVTTTKLADNSVDSRHYVDGSIDPEHLANLAVQTAKIADLAVTTAKLGNDSVTGAKIGNDQINSEHYAAGSIDNEHLANNSVGEANIITAAVTANKLDVITGTSWKGNSATSLFASWTTMVSTPSITIPANSLCIVQVAADVNVTLSADVDPSIAIFDITVAGTQPTGTQGQMLWRPHFRGAGYNQRRTMERTYIFKPTSTLTGVISLRGSVNTYDGQVAWLCNGGAGQSTSHTQISYMIFRA